MRLLSFFLGTLLIISFSVSCTSKAEKKAKSDFQYIDGLISRNELSTAMQLLDSMMSLNKDEYGIVGDALRRKNKIAVDYHKEAIAGAEKLLSESEARFAELSRDFRLIPGEAGTPGTYEHKRQTVESPWNRTFLKIGISENGNTWLISHYYGKSWIDHTSLRIYDQNDFILTDTIPLGHEWNRKVEDMGDRWETVEFRDGSDAGAIAFIADNYLKPVKARLTGKSFYYIVLESYDKDAFRKGWELAQVLKDRYAYRESIRIHQTELRKLGA